MTESAKDFGHYLSSYTAPLLKRMSEWNSLLG